MDDSAIAIQLQRVSFSRGRSQILRDVSFNVEKGRVFGLIGRSGCGKSTTLRLISGLIRPDKGSVTVFGLPAHEYAADNRCVATVWQDRALFPHLSVRGNLEFALRVHKFEGRKVDGKEREKRVKRVAADLRLTSLLDRSVLALSGGEQQRVALARAMLIEPKILLLDEPFTGLDQELKLELQADLRELVRDYRFTYVLVSHLQEDVFSLSDRVAVLDTGEIVQEGTRAELYERPANAFIAKFVGGNNVIRATVRTVNNAAGRVQVEVGGESGLWQARHLPGVRENDLVCYVIGPQHVKLGENGACSVEASFWASEENGVSEVLSFRLRSGMEFRTYRFLDGGNHRSYVSRELVKLSWNPCDAFIVKESDRRVSAADQQ